MRGRKATLLLVLPLLLVGGSAARPLAPVRVRAASPACTVVQLNEVLPEAAQVDWDGDGIACPIDEWIELHNLTGTACDLGGWQLDDLGSGSPPYTIPAGTELASDGYAVLYRRQTGIALPNTVGTVRLLRPDGSWAAQFRYPDTRPDRSWSLEPGGLNWTFTYPPTPGRANGPGRRTYLPLVLLSR